VDIRAPYRLTIGAGGINVYASVSAAYISGGGVLTSSQKFLDVWLRVQGENFEVFHIGSVIADNGVNSVGLRIRGPVNNGYRAVVLDGDKSNTFTGPVLVSGRSTRITLNKTKGAIAISGDIFIDSGARIALWGSKQIGRNSTVRLRDSSFQFTRASFIKEESFHKLVVEGKSLLHFDWSGSPQGKRFLYLDDLSIANGAELVVQGWREGTHFFLVRKTSSNLEDALKRIAFKEYLPGRTQLEDYNKDYWAISGTPEPATYGATFGVVGIGLVVWRKNPGLASGASPPPVGGAFGSIEQLPRLTSP